MARLQAVKEQEAMVTGNDTEMESLIEYSINLEDQERPPILPIGEYTGEVTGVEKKFGKDSGRPYLNVKLSIPSENQPADFVEQLGTQGPVTLFYMVFGLEDNPTSRFNMKLFCEALRIPLSNRFSATDFLNKECRIQVKHGQDLSGNPRPEVAKVVRA
jgi:hypothetical protein